MHFQRVVLIRCTQPAEMMIQKSAKKLTGVRAVVVEDDPLIALDVAMTLQQAGADVYGPYPNCTSALAAIETLSQTIGITLAVLDVDLGRETSEPVARALMERGIPFVFHTGNDWHNGCTYDGVDAPVVQKPSSPEMLIAGVVKCWSGQVETRS